jgi:hypothetical protein
MMRQGLLVVLFAVAAVALPTCDREAPGTAAPGIAAPGIAAPGTAAPGGASSPAVGVKPYPLKTCIVSGEVLGSMGDPIVLVHEGQEVKFCCDGCTGEFKKNPAKYLAKLPVAKPADDHAGHDHDHAH